MRQFRKYGSLWIAAFLWIAFAGVFLWDTAYQATAGVSSWRREGLKDQVDQLRADLDQLQADHDALVIRLETVRSAGAFCMAYQVGRQTTLRDAEFQVGYQLADVAGTWHSLTQEQVDAFTVLATTAEAHYAALTGP